MSEPTPLVTIGIPTYNRANVLNRSIESALRQDYKNLEVIISDNASTDHTPAVCETYRLQDARIRYIRSPHNLGATANFLKALEVAKGEFFMWLGDDDWIDDTYVRRCVERLLMDSNLALVSGTPRYHRNGTEVATGRTFDALDRSWWRRLVNYYVNVQDNGMFYGVLRTEQARSVQMRNTMGGDWLFIAGVLSRGKSMMLRDVFVHRELGGASGRAADIAKSLRLPPIQARFQKTSIVVGVWHDIAFGRTHRDRNLLTRLGVATITSSIVALRHVRAGILNALRGPRSSRSHSGRP
jgi:glycosyltransferase involved in cell wall biosynthesis